MTPTNDGGAAIADYIIQHRVGTGAWVTVNDGVGTQLTRTVSGLTNGTTYQFRVFATNSAGDSAASNVVSATPRTVPTPPRSLTAVPTNVAGQLRLSWLLPTTNGGSAITDYVIQRSPNGTSWTTIADGVGTTTAYTVTGLANGTRYWFRVLAKNAVGNSPWSNVTNAVPRTKPSAPRSLTATPGNGRVTLKWLAPTSNGGSAITDYVIQRAVAGGSWVTISDGVRATTGSTVTGLRNGTRYYFRVFAKNAAGSSPSSNTVSTSPRTVPSAPRALTATPTNLSGQVRLSWQLPASNGGSVITDYVIQRSANGTSNWSTISDGLRATRTFTVTGLKNGARYYFRVLAKNAAGVGPSSNVASAIPRAKPSAPALRATPGNGRVRLTWTPPTSTGGSPITRYVLQRSTSPTGGWVSLSTSIPPTARSFTSTGLRNGTRYYFRLAAVNAAGQGAWSGVVGATPSAPQPPPPPPPSPGCSPSYPTVCIPPPPPDLDCGQITFRRFRVLQPDPHNFDADLDGVGCES